MEQNEYFNTLFNLAETDEQKERVAFATLVAHFVRGEMHELLKDAPVGVCEELGRIWDAQSHVPVGVLLQRPKFEEYEALHKAAQQTTN